MAKKKSGGAAAAPVSAPAAPAPEAPQTDDDGFVSLADVKADEPAPVETPAEPKEEPKPEKPAKEPADKAKPKSLDQLMDEVGTDMKKGGPAKEPKAPKVEGKSPPVASPGYDDDEDPKQQGDPADPEPDPKAAEPTPVTREDHPLTPEETTLLRRSKATEDQIAAYAGVPVAQRNLLLAPLRQQAANMDKLFGLPKEQREAALEKQRQDLTDPAPQEDRATAEIRQKLTPDPAKLEKFAKANGLDEASVQDLIGLIMEGPKAVLDELDRRDKSRAFNEKVSTLRSAGDHFRAELTARFPKMKDDAEYRALVTDPDFTGLYGAYVDSGLDVREAVGRAMRKVATLRYMSEIQQRNRQADPKATAQARSTAEPTRKPRGPAEPQPRPRNLSEAMDRVGAEMLGEG